MSDDEARWLETPWADPAFLKVAEAVRAALAEVMPLPVLRLVDREPLASLDERRELIELCVRIRTSQGGKEWAQWQIARVLNDGWQPAPPAQDDPTDAAEAQRFLAEFAAHVARVDKTKHPAVPDDYKEAYTRFLARCAPVLEQPVEVLRAWLAEHIPELTKTDAINIAETFVEAVLREPMTGSPVPSRSLDRHAKRMKRHSDNIPPPLTGTPRNTIYVGK